MTTPHPFTFTLISDNYTERQEQQELEMSFAGVRCQNQSWSGLPTKQLHAGSFCAPDWAYRHCWPATPIGQNISRKCSELLVDHRNVHTGGKLLGVVTRICSENGSWYWHEFGNYSVCKPPEVISSLWQDSRVTKEIIRYVLFVGSVLSLLFLVTALVIFLHFKSIRCGRITIHIHFMIALAVKSCVLILISDPTPFSKIYYYKSVGWICKSVVIVHLYSYMASINWMLVQGHFLNSKLATDVFQKRFRIKLYCLYGWGIPIAFVFLWYLLMEKYHDVPCWRHYSKSKLIWIIGAPCFSALMINALFLVNIVRILLNKMKKKGNPTESEQFNILRIHCGIFDVRSAAKATAFLFPLLGINNLVFFFNPGGGTIQIYYWITNAVLQPLQGIVVAILYCFVCKDVREAIRREYGKFSAKRNLSSSVRMQSGRIHHSVIYHDRCAVHSHRNSSPDIFLSVNFDQVHVL